MGDHDENISYAEVKTYQPPACGAGPGHAIALYRFASEHAAQRGLIIADTKFEFGLAPDGELILIDEALTPDSSRFWPPINIAWDQSTELRQAVRADYLETLDWNKKAPGLRSHRGDPATAANYSEALRRLTGPAPRASA